MTWLFPRVDPFAEGFFVRLGRLLFWVGTAAAGGFLAAAVILVFQPHIYDPAAWITCLILAPVCYLPGRALRYLLAGE